MNWNNVLVLKKSIIYTQLMTFDTSVESPGAILVARKYLNTCATPKQLPHFHAYIFDNF